MVSQTLDSEYESIINDLFSQATGSEAVLLCKAVVSDSLDLIPICLGTAKAPTEAEKQAVLDMAAMPERKDSDLFIKEGKYLFTQFPYVGGKDGLFSQVMASLDWSKKIDSFYLRFIKENQLEVVIQLLQPEDNC